MTTLLLFLSHTFPKARAATAWSNHLLETIRTIRLYFARTSAPEEKTEPVFLNLLRSPGINSQPAGRYDNPICRTGPPGYIGWWNRFLGSLNIYKYGLRFVQALRIRQMPNVKGQDFRETDKRFTNNKEKGDGT
jgi:hypothetical protein